MNPLVCMVALVLVFCPCKDLWADAQAAGAIETQVLRIFTSKNSGYYHKPWKTPDFSHIKGSGFFFRDEASFPGKEGLILTNAHTVSLAQSIRVSNGREKRQYEVKLLGICHSADFAVLQMEPKELEAYEARNGKVIPIELGDSDKLRVADKVVGWGYPLGGENLSKSEQGEISRIEVNQYVYSQDRWLMVQASLQQNRGNSGGPVLKNGKAVGIAFQGMRTTDRINYFIPINVVRNLVPVLNKQDTILLWQYRVQHMFPRLKEFYNLLPDQGGVLLDYIVPEGGPYKFGLRCNDIVVEIDGHEIDNFGEIFFQPLEQKVDFAEILNRKRVGDPLTIKVIRDGKILVLEGKATPGLPKLVPRIFTSANYFILGGIGFVELTLNCIENLGKTGERLRAKYAEDFPKEPFQKIVIISEIFPEYGLVDSSPFLKRVEKIDGRKVLNVEDLYNAIKSLASQGRKKILLEIAGHLQLPLDLEKAPQLDAGIQHKYGILYMKTAGGFSR